MPVMSAVESAFCRSAPWRLLARRAILPWSLAGDQLTGDVLEIGGGSGAMADGIARTCSRVRLTVTDVDDTMVAAARARLADHKNVVVERANVTALPFEESSFDAVTSHLMLHHVIAWQDALTEAARVLRPGGVFIGYDLTDTRLARLIHRADRSPHRIISVAELLHGLVSAGLEAVSVHPSGWGHLMRFRAEKARRGGPATMLELTCHACAVVLDATTEAELVALGMHHARSIHGHEPPREHVLARIRHHNQ